MRFSETLFSASAASFEKAKLEAFHKRSRAGSLFASFWLSEDETERRRIAEKCIGLAEEAARIFEGLSDEKELAKTHNDLLRYLMEAIDLATDWNALNSRFEQGLLIGRKTVRECESLEESEGLIEATHQLLSLQAAKAQVVLDSSKFQSLAKDTLGLAARFTEIAQKAGTKYALCLADESTGDVAFNLEGDYAKTTKLYEQAIKSARNLKDSAIVGRLLWRLAAGTSWRGASSEYTESRRELLQKAIGYSDLAIQSLMMHYHTTYLGAIHANSAQCYVDLANTVETELEKKREYLSRAIALYKRGMMYGNQTWGWLLCGNGLGKSMYFLSLIEPNVEEKDSLLREAMPIVETTVQVTDLLFPHSWNRGVVRNYLALIKAKLAEREQDPQARIRLVGSAAGDMKQCLDICSGWATVPGLMQRVARYSESYGDILLHLHQLTLEPENVKNAIGAYRESKSFLAKSGIIGPQGALSWKVAKANDSMGKFTEASEAFKTAAEEYRLAGEKVPGLTKSFHDIAAYMEAWASIEEARRCHAEEEYDLSHKNYLKASELLRTTKTWSGLSLLCDARSSLERGEALSHEEKHLAAVESLREALGASRLAKDELGQMSTVATDISERLEIDEWIRIAEQREAYTNGRIELEQARSLEKGGKKIACSRKYKSAGLAFRRLAVQTVTPQDQAELATLAQLCESWAQRKEAESKSSPELFAEAAESFMRARETATNESLRLLALGDASICRALESGTRFRQSRDTRLYSDIKRQLEIAADHYTEAGFKKTGVWTRATQRLFDALMLLTEAEGEREIKKKTELYQIAEKHLVLAARLYGEAGFPSRRRETLEQLERTREEKEILLAPLEALAEIPTATATHLPSITLRGAQPLGLERFEDAKVTGELRTPQTHLTMGSDFTINIDIANVGKTPATLIKLEGVVPEGCEPVDQQNTPNLEGNSLDLRGKRLEYLKTHGVQVSFRPTRKGEFELSPRVVYVDEKGNYKSTNLQPLYLTIREPGISEGLHAPPTVHLPQDFQFENERSRQVLSQLVKEFLDDYMTRRIVMERAGWRSLMDMIREVKIPRSAMYGPGGRTGPVLAELERRGLVETRVFPKERGRGGEIRKLRVAYENTIVRRIVDRAVMENA